MKRVASLSDARKRAEAFEVEDQKTIEARRTGCDDSTCIVPNLFVGPVKTAEDLAALQALGVSVIVNCAKELANFHPEQPFTYLNLELEDSEEDADKLRWLLPCTTSK